MIKAVIFDLDNTLYSYDDCNRYAFEALSGYMAKYGVIPETFQQEFYAAREEVKNRLPYDFAARHNRILYCQRCAERLGLNPFSCALDMYRMYWDSFLAKAKLYDNADKVLHYLKENSIKIGICTDMTAQIQFRKIQQLGIEKLIDSMVSSEEAGAEKPSGKIFSLMLEKLNVSPEECVYVGDDYHRDIQGADAAGMKTVYFSSDCTKDTFRCRNYDEMMDFLRQLLRERNTK